MKLFTKAIERKLIDNFNRAESGTEVVDFKPVVKLFGGAACTWLLTELNPENGLAYGLCDLGLGFPECGAVSIEELQSIKFPPFGLPIERDMHFKADKTLSEYSAAAGSARRILA